MSQTGSAFAVSMATVNTRETHMTTNMGGIDRGLRIVVGLALLWYALLAPATGYNWIGWIGVVPLITALIGNCPLYSILGVSTCPVKKA
jgi:hypothetical protein